MQTGGTWCPYRIRYVNGQPDDMFARLLGGGYFPQMSLLYVTPYYFCPDQTGAVAANRPPIGQHITGANAFYSTFYQHRLGWWGGGGTDLNGLVVDSAHPFKFAPKADNFDSKIALVADLHWGEPAFSITHMQAGKNAVYGDGSGRFVQNPDGHQSLYMLPTIDPNPFNTTPASTENMWLTVFDRRRHSR